MFGFSLDDAPALLLGLIEVDSDYAIRMGGNGLDRIPSQMNGIMSGTGPLNFEASMRIGSWRALPLCSAGRRPAEHADWIA